MSRSRAARCTPARLERRAALAAALIALALPSSGDDGTRGRKLFLGEMPLTARITGQDFALPAQASRCINCHATRAPSASASGATGPSGPLLDAASLSQPQRRRGGPPSRYDADTLCTLLRRGVDPAYVMIQRTMPRYEISDADCRALWQHLVQGR